MLMSSKMISAEIMNSVLSAKACCHHVKISISHLKLNILWKIDNEALLFIFDVNNRITYCSKNNITMIRIREVLLAWLDLKCYLNLGNWLAARLMQTKTHNTVLCGINRKNLFATWFQALNVFTAFRFSLTRSLTPPKAYTTSSRLSSFTRTKL